MISFQLIFCRPLHLNDSVIFVINGEPPRNDAAVVGVDAEPRKKSNCSIRAKGHPQGMALHYRYFFSIPPAYLLLPLADMKDIVNYLRMLTPMGWVVILIFTGLGVLALYSQFRKRRSTEK